MVKLSTLFRDWYMAAAFAVSIFLLAAAGIFAYREFAHVEHFLIIHFEAGRGGDLLGSKYDVFSFIGAAYALFAMNGWLAHAFYRRERALAYLIASFTVFLAVLIFIAVAVIINVN